MGATLVVTLVTWLGIVLSPAERSPAAVELAILVVELVTWLGIVRARDSLVVVVTSAVVLVTWLVIVIRGEAVEEEVEALVLVTSVVVLVTWLGIVTGEEAAEEAGEALVDVVVASATSAVKVVTLRGSVLLLDCFLINETMEDGDEFE